MFADLLTNLDAGCGGAGGAVGGRQHVLRGDQGAAAPGRTFKIFYAVIKYFSVENIFSFKYLPRSNAASRDDPHLPGVLVNLGLLAADNSINSVRADIIDVLDIVDNMAPVDSVGDAAHTAGVARQRGGGGGGEVGGGVVGGADHPGSLQHGELIKYKGILRRQKCRDY